MSETSNDSHSKENPAAKAWGNVSEWAMNRMIKKGRAVELADESLPKGYDSPVIDEERLAPLAVDEAVESYLPDSMAPVDNYDERARKPEPDPPDLDESPSRPDPLTASTDFDIYHYLHKKM